MPQSLSGEVLLVVLDFPLSGMRFQNLPCCLQREMASPVGREDRELRHGVVRTPPQVRVRAEHGEPNEDVVVVDEIRAPPRIREILLEMPVVQVPGLIHLVRVEHRHLIQILLVDVPEQVAVGWMDGMQADHEWCLTVGLTGLYLLDGNDHNPQPIPRLRHGVADYGLIAVGEEGIHGLLGEV